MVSMATMVICPSRPAFGSQAWLMKSGHGFAPTTTYEVAWEGRRYPPKAILGTAYEFATGRRLGSSDFEGGKVGAVRVLGQLGFTVEKKRRLIR
jgi:hypothetical protein